jgi:regulator of nucleoside diphosphate kinase
MARPGRASKKPKPQTDPFRIMDLPIAITEQDAARLRRLLDSNVARKDTDTASLRRLERELDRATLVPQSELPTDAIAMNSTVELEDLSDGEILTFTLVYPEQADATSGRISILAPLGMAMLGYRVGDEFEWPVPSGTIRVRVRRLIESPGSTPPHPVLDAAEFRR